MSESKDFKNKNISVIKLFFLVILGLLSLALKFRVVVFFFNFVRSEKLVKHLKLFNLEQWFYAKILVLFKVAQQELFPHSATFLPACV